MREVPCERSKRNDEFKACGSGCNTPGYDAKCIVCHNPHQGVYKDGKWEDQTVAEHNKFAFKGKDKLGTEHTWRTFNSTRELCLDCHGRGDHGANVSDPTKVTGKEGAWFQHDWYGNDRPIPKIEGLGDERGALPMDDPDDPDYNVWKMEKMHYGAGNAPYGSANYTERKRTAVISVMAVRYLLCMERKCHLRAMNAATAIQRRKIRH